MEGASGKKCSYENKKLKFLCDEAAVDGEFCFWHKDVAKDYQTIREYCAKSPLLDKELKKYNYSIAAFLRERAKKGGKFVDYNLKGVNLKATDLSGLDLKYINFSGADFRGSNLRGV